MEIKTRVPGNVAAIKVKVGDQVTVKQELAVMEAMKMLTRFPCPIDGEVTEICVEEGQRVPAGTVLMIVE